MTRGRPIKMVFVDNIGDTMAKKDFMTVKESSALVLLSGGMDSVTLLYYVRDVLNYSKVEVLLFDYGQRHKIELEYARALAVKLGIPSRTICVDLTQFGGSSLTEDDESLTVVTPARNSIFLSLATAYAETRGIPDIFFGPNAEDFTDFPDCREEFIEAMSQALSLGNNIRGVYAPFVNKSKEDIVKIGRALGVDFGGTWSCYHPTEESKPCGKCHACELREEALNTD